MLEIGITERGDAALDLSWRLWVEKGKYAILITKNPLKLIEILSDKIDQTLYKNIILHCTITGMGDSFLEPNVPSFKDNIEAYKSIKNKFKIFPFAKIVLRVDPIIPVEPALSKQLEVIKILGKKEYFDEIRISFIDNYYHIREKVNLPWNDIHAPLEMRQSAYDEIKKLTDLNIRICGEPDFECTGCVSVSDINAFHINLNSVNLYTKGQRQCCACVAAKKELLDNKHPCEHNCAYCYWKH